MVERPISMHAFHWLSEMTASPSSPLLSIVLYTVALFHFVANRVVVDDAPPPFFLYGCVAIYFKTVHGIRFVFSS